MLTVDVVFTNIGGEGGIATGVVTVVVMADGWINGNVEVLVRVTVVGAELGTAIEGVVTEGATEEELPLEVIIVMVDPDVVRVL